MTEFQKGTWLLLAFFSLSLVSCGDNNESSSKVSSKTCEELNCLSSISWKIIASGFDFPQKARLSLDGETLLDECETKQKYSITRDAQPQFLNLEQFHIPQKENMKIEIFDKGEDCSMDEKVYSHEKLSYEWQKNARDSISEIIISL
jgi:hypothetical protein